MLANPETPPKIDWAAYKNKVPVAGMVDSFQKQYESLKVPYPADSVSAQIDQQKSQVQKEIEQFVNASKSRISEHEKSLAHLARSVLISVECTIAPSFIAILTFIVILIS